MGIASVGARAAGESVPAQLKAALASSEARLGALEPWQKRIFADEALPQYQRFIRDYRSSASGVKADAHRIRTRSPRLDM